MTITLRLSGINLFVSTNWNDRTDGLAPNEITHPREFRSRWPIFPNPSLGPGALLIRRVHTGVSTRIIYIAACAFLPRINVFRRSRTGPETRRRQVQIYRRTFPERAYPSDPAALITFHEISSNSFCSFLPPSPAPHGREDPPSKRSRHWRVPFARRSWWIRGIRWEQKDVGLTWKACLLFWWGIMGWIPGVDA